MGPKIGINDPAVLSRRWPQPSTEQLLNPYIDPHVNRWRHRLTWCILHYWTPTKKKYNKISEGQLSTFFANVRELFFTRMQILLIKLQRLVYKRITGKHKRQSLRIPQSCVFRRQCMCRVAKHSQLIDVMFVLLRLRFEQASPKLISIHRNKYCIRK
jgi:hypothetical protein